MSSNEVVPNVTSPSEAGVSASPSAPNQEQPVATVTPQQVSPTTPVNAQTQVVPTARPDSMSTSTGSDRPVAFNPIVIPDAPEGVVETTADKMKRILGQFVRVAEQVGSFYKYRGVCVKCGWQTMQNDAQQAKDLVTEHAQRHWREFAHLL